MTSGRVGEIDEINGVDGINEKASKFDLALRAHPPLEYAGGVRHGLREDSAHLSVAQAWTTGQYP